MIDDKPAPREFVVYYDEAKGTLFAKGEIHGLPMQVVDKAALTLANEDTAHYKREFDWAKEQILKPPAGKT